MDLLAGCARFPARACNKDETFRSSAVPPLRGDSAKTLSWHRVCWFGSHTRGGEHHGMGALPQQALAPSSHIDPFFRGFSSKRYPEHRKRRRPAVDESVPVIRRRPRKEVSGQDAVPDAEAPAREREMWWGADAPPTPSIEGTRTTTTPPRQHSSKRGSAAGSVQLSA